MSSDPGMLPPVPAQYGALDGAPPGSEAPSRVSRRRARGREAGSGSPGTQPAAVPGEVAPELAPTGAVPLVDDHGQQHGQQPHPVPDGAVPAAPEGPGLGWWGRQNRTEVQPAEGADGAQEHLGAGRFHRETVRLVRGRRSRRIVRRVDTWTVLKVSLMFYLCVLVVVLITGAVLWNLAQAFNFTHDIEKSIKTLFGYSTFTLHAGPMFGYTALGGIVLCVIGTLVNVLAAMVYNLIADVVGGIQIIVVSEEAESDVS